MFYYLFTGNSPSLTTSMQSSSTRGICRLEICRGSESQTSCTFILIWSLRLTSRKVVVQTLSSLSFIPITDMRNFQGFFNISMSYRLDADIHHGYGEFLKVATHPNTAAKLSETIMNFATANKHLAVKEKLKNETWICQFVSNCETKSERNAFVKTFFIISFLKKILLIELSRLNKSLKRRSCEDIVKVHERWYIREMRCSQL